MPKKAVVTSRVACTRIVRLLEQLPAVERERVLDAARAMVALDVAPNPDYTAGQ